MKKFFVILFLLLRTHSWAQDVGVNDFQFGNSDTAQITFGIRIGSINLTQPVRIFEKKDYDDFPKRLGVGNLIIDFRTRFARDTVLSGGHDALFGINVALLRSKVFVGYQYNRKIWYSSIRFGYEVIRDPHGEYKAGRRRFAKNIPIIGFEFGLVPYWINKTFRFHALAEYDFERLGWFTSGSFTSKIFSTENIRCEVGLHLDAVFGYGYLASCRIHQTLLYVSTFQGQFFYQERRFPDQKIGMEKGIAFGIQTSLK